MEYCIVEEGPLIETNFPGPKMGRIEDQVVTKAINNFTIHLAAAKCYFEQAVETSVVEKINLVGTPWNNFQLSRVVSHYASRERRSLFLLHHRNEPDENSLTRIFANRCPLNQHVLRFINFPTLNSHATTTTSCNHGINLFIQVFRTDFFSRRSFEWIANCRDENVSSFFFFFSKGKCNFYFTVWITRGLDHSSWNSIVEPLITNRMTDRWSINLSIYNRNKWNRITYGH